MLEEIRSVSDELFITTDDGSSGRKGLVTDPLEELFQKKVKIDRVITIGPAIMMKVVAEITRKDGVPTVASLNPIMIDAT